MFQVCRDRLSLSSSSDVRQHDKRARVEATETKLKQERICGSKFEMP